LSVFSTCVLQSVCVHTMDFVSAINKQINKINKLIFTTVTNFPFLLPRVFAHCGRLENVEKR